jgi:hypothetical protein
MKKPDNLCMAPWTHTYLSPQTERRLCCASREPAQSFTQYIDSSPGDDQYTPSTLEEHWNSPHMRRIRLQMLADQVPAECEVCDKRLLNTDVYRDYFNQLFQNDWDQVAASTDATGATTMRPVSWDYRFSNVCNFRCRMCGPMLSSAWEAESRDNGFLEAWQAPRVKRKISAFQRDVVENEFNAAVEACSVREIYWVGGEPLLMSQHWRYMPRIIELNAGKDLYARYNTNLSSITSGNCHLFTDILPHVRDWQVCASLDGVGAVGEYIRTGLDYDQFIVNFRTGLESARHSRNMRLDFTLTTPGLGQIIPIMRLASSLGVDVLAKVCFAFTPDIAMSPLFIPAHILHPIINSILPSTSGAMRDVLSNLLDRPTFDQQYPDTYLSARSRAKRRIQTLDSGRNGIGFEDTLGDFPQLLEWWRSIDTSCT